MATTTPQKPQTPIWAKLDNDNFNQEKSLDNSGSNLTPKTEIKSPPSTGEWSANPWEAPAGKSFEVKMEKPSFSAKGSMEISFNTVDKGEMAKQTLKQAIKAEAAAEVGAKAVVEIGKFATSAGKEAVSAFSGLMDVLRGTGEYRVDIKKAAKAPDQQIAQKQKESIIRQNLMQQETDRTRMENMRFKKSMEEDKRLGTGGSQEQMAAASGATNKNYQESNNIYSKVFALMRNSWQGAKQKAAQTIKPPSSKKAAGGGANFNGQEAFDKTGGGTVYSAGG